MQTATKATANCSSLIQSADERSFSDWMLSLPGMESTGRWSYFHSGKNVAVHFVPTGKAAPPEGIIVHQDLWHHKPEIIKSRIQSILGLNQKIPGKRTEVVVLAPEVFRHFLIKNHLFGAVRAKVRLGLIYKGELVAIAGFSKPCPIHRDGRVLSSVEFVRFCTALGTNVMGGTGKLVRYYLENFRPEDLMSTVDLEWSGGNGFREIGFREISRTAPTAFLVKKGSLERYGPGRFSEEMKKASEDKNALESLDTLGYLPVRNRGNAKWVYP